MGTITIKDGISLAGTDGKLVTTAALNDAEGDEVALQLNYTTNKATSGADTGLEIVQTDTASPGTSYLINAKVGATSKFSVAASGDLRLAGNGTIGSTAWISANYGGSEVIYLGSTYGQGLHLPVAGVITWEVTSSLSAPDIGMHRSAAGVVAVNLGGADGKTGYGALELDTNSRQYADTVTITDNTKTPILDIAIADGEFVGGRLVYTITVTDATDHQAMSGSVTFSATRKNGTPDTYHAAIAEDVTPVLAESSGASTLTDTWELDAGTDEVVLSLTANSSLTPSAMTCRYHLILNSLNAVTKK